MDDRVAVEGVPQVGRAERRGPESGEWRNLCPPVVLDAPAQGEADLQSSHREAPHGGLVPVVGAESRRWQRSRVDDNLAPDPVEEHNSGGLGEAGGLSFDVLLAVLASSRDFDQIAWQGRRPLSRGNQADLNEAELTRNIIGTIGEVDSYRLPDARGFDSMQRYLIGDTDEARQRMREEILLTTAADIRTFAAE